MVKLTVVPVIPLALSEAMKAATFAISASVMSRRGCVLSRGTPGTAPRSTPLPRRGARRLLDRGCLRHRLWSQPDHANAARCELGGQLSREGLLGRHRRTVASHQRDARPRGECGDGHEAPGPFATIRRAAVRAVRKYELV